MEDRERRIMNTYKKEDLLLKFFLHKRITVKGFKCQATGELVAFQGYDRERHIPSVLIFKTENAKTIWRGAWMLITEADEKG